MMAVLFHSKLNHPRLVNDKAVMKLRLVASYAARLLDLHSVKTNGARTFTEGLNDAAGSVFSNLYQALIHYGLDESQAFGDAVPDVGVGAGGLAGAAVSRELFGVVTEGHIARGSNDTPSDFVATAVFLQSPRDYSGLSRSSALSKFQASTAGYSGTHRFSLVDLSDYSVIQRFYNGVFGQVVQASGTKEYIGDALLHLEGNTTGWVVFKSMALTDEVLEYFNQANESTLQESTPWILTPVQVTDELKAAKTRYTPSKAANDALLDYAVAVWYSTVNDAVAAANAVEAGAFVVDGGGVYLNGDKGWDIYPRKFKFIRGLVANDVVINPPPPPPPPPIDDELEYGLIVKKHIYRNQSDTLQNLVLNMQRIEGSQWFTSQLDALAWFATFDVSMNFSFVRMSDMAVLRENVGGVSVEGIGFAGDCTVSGYSAGTQHRYIDSIINVNVERVSFYNAFLNCNDWYVQQITGDYQNIVPRLYYGYRNKVTNVYTPALNAPDVDYFETEALARAAVLAIDAHGLDKAGYDYSNGQVVFVPAGDYEITQRDLGIGAGWLL